jgi:hypothetical protein
VVHDKVVHALGGGKVEARLRHPSAETTPRLYSQPKRTFSLTLNLDRRYGCILRSWFVIGSVRIQKEDSVSQRVESEVVFYLRMICVTGNDEDHIVCLLLIKKVSHRKRRPFSFPHPPLPPARLRHQVLRPRRRFCEYLSRSPSTFTFS